MLTASCLVMLPCAGEGRGGEGRGGEGRGGEGRGGEGRRGEGRKWGDRQDNLGCLSISLSLVDLHTWLFSLTRKAWNLERRGDLRMNFLVSGTCQARRLGYLHIHVDRR